MPDSRLQVEADGIRCNRSYVSAGLVSASGWSKWVEPVPVAPGGQVHAAAPLEQLGLTHDRSDYLFYSATIAAPTAVHGNGAEHGERAPANGAVNMTIATIESDAMLVFFDGKFVGAADDHSKGPNRLTLTLPVPALTAPTTSLVILSASLGIQNFHGTNPTQFVKGILGDVTIDGHAVTTPAGGWDHRAKLAGCARSPNGAGERLSLLATGLFLDRRAAGRSQILRGSLGS